MDVIHEDVEMDGKDMNGFGDTGTEDLDGVPFKVNISSELAELHNSNKPEVKFDTMTQSETKGRSKRAPTRKEALSTAELQEDIDAATSMTLEDYFGFEADHRHRSNEIVKLPVHILAMYDNKMSRLNLINATLAACSVLLTIILMEINFDHGSGRYKEKAAMDWPAQLVKTLTTIVTISTQIGLHKYYKVQISRDCASYGCVVPPMRYSRLFKWYLVEALTCLIHAPPFGEQLGVPVVMVDKASIVTLVRLYLFLRVYRDYSHIFKWRRWVAMTMNLVNPDTNVAGLEFTTFLTFKHVYNRRPWFFFLSATLLSVVFFSYGMYIAERIENPYDFSDPAAVVYFVFVTMTTLGYGDILPTSGWGRTVAVCCSVWGIGLAALLLTTLLHFLDFTITERHVSNLIVKRKYTHKAVQLTEDIVALDEKLLQHGPPPGKEWSKAFASKIAPVSAEKYEVPDGSNPDNVTFTVDPADVPHDEYGMPAGMCGVACVPKAVDWYSQKLYKIRKLREYTSRERGLVTADDKISQIASEINDIHVALSHSLEATARQVKRGKAKKKMVRMSMSTNIKALTSISKTRTKASSTFRERTASNASNDLQSQMERTSTFLKDASAKQAEFEKYVKKQDSIFQTGVNRRIVFGDHEEDTQEEMQTMYPEFEQISLEDLNKHDKKMQQLNIMQVVLTLLTIVLTSIMLEVGWHEYETTGDITHFDAYGSPVYASSSNFTTSEWMFEGGYVAESFEGGYYEKTDATIYYKIFITIFTLCNVGLLYYYYQIQVTFDVRVYKDSGPSTNVSIWNSDRRWYFLAEVLLCLLHAPPGFDEITWNENGETMRLVYDKFAAICWFRLYVVVRVYRDWSHIYRYRYWVMQSGEYRKNNPVIQFGTLFSLKHLYNNNPWIFVTGGTALFWFFFSYWVYISERAEQPTVLSYASDVFYFTAVSMTTIGYGDVSPITNYGRFTIVIATLVGIILATLLATAMLTSVQFTPNERIASQLILTREMWEGAQHTSARLIQVVWAQYCLRKKNMVPPSLNSYAGTKVLQDAQIVNLIQTLNFQLNELGNLRSADVQANTVNAVDRLGERMLVLTTNMETLTKDIEQVQKKVPHLFDEDAFVAKIKKEAIEQYKMNQKSTKKRTQLSTETEELVEGIKLHYSSQDGKATASTALTSPMQEVKEGDLTVTVADDDVEELRLSASMRANSVPSVLRPKPKEVAAPSSPGEVNTSVSVFDGGDA